jgi:hypothetical protein
VGRLHRTLLNFSAKPDEVMMPIRSSARLISGVLGALAVLLGAAPASSQTHDEARLTVGVAVGYIHGTSLWSVDRQPIINSDRNQDLLNIQRTLTSNLTLSAQATFYRSSHLGYTAEFTYIGLGTEDACELAGSPGGDIGGPACLALKGDTRPASAVSVMGGAVWRPISHTAAQPYVKGMLGAALVPHSTLLLAANWGALLENRMEIYTGTSSHMIRPAATIGAGIATAPSAGYQLSIEVRETWAMMPVVTGPTQYQLLVPPSANRIKSFPSFLVGLSIVLERQRGRRY